MHLPDPGKVLQCSSHCYQEHPWSLGGVICMYARHPLHCLQHLIVKITTLSHVDLTKLSWAAEMAPGVRFLLSKHEDLSWDTKDPHKARCASVLL